jgi:hypothetical protein
MFIVTGAIAKKLIPVPSCAISWITIFIALTIPAIWLPIFRGYPDTGAVLLIAAAILAYVQDIRLRKWWWQVPSIGIFCAFGIIFRRHFVYSVIALFVSIGLTLFFISLLQWKREPKKIFLEIAKQWLKLGGAGIICLLTLFLIARPFILRALETNYSALYQSYNVPILEVAKYFFMDYGIILWLFVGIGLIIGIYKRLLVRPIALFIVLFGGLSFLQWIVIVRQMGVHYPLHLALAVMLGLSAFGWILWNIRTAHIRWAAMSIFAGLLVLNLFAGLAPIHLSSSVSQVLALNQPPLYRDDYDEVARFIAYLRQITEPGQMIYVVDSSTLMNFDAVYKAEQGLYGYDNTKLSLFETPQIDSRDYYPLERLLRADYVVVTTPFQHHLREEEQKVAKFVFDAFSQNLEIARDFKLLPEQFKLSGGAILSIYKRQNTTSLETTLLTFDRMRKYIDRWPGSQEDWILITRNSNLQASKIQDQRYSFTLTPSSSFPDTSASFLFAQSLPVSGSVHGNVNFLNNDCAQVRVDLRQFQPSGRILTENDQVISTDSGVFNLSFQPLDSSNTLLILDVQNIPQTSSESLCSFALDWEWQGAK